MIGWLPVQKFLQIEAFTSVQVDVSLPSHEFKMMMATTSWNICLFVRLGDCYYFCETMSDD